VALTVAVASCSFDSCDGPIKARGWCGKHYYRWLNHGDPSVRLPQVAGPTHPNWNGGRSVDTNGYVYVWTEEDDPMRVMCRPGKGYTLPEHRLVMARSLGRPLESHEEVHHINGDRADNRLENLEMWSKSHPYGQRLRCRACGSHDVEAV
jgi:hypothetical protein